MYRRLTFPNPTRTNRSHIRRKSHEHSLPHDTPVISYWYLFQVEGLWQVHKVKTNSHRYHGTSSGSFSLTCSIPRSNIFDLTIRSAVTRCMDQYPRLSNRSWTQPAYPTTTRWRCIFATLGSNNHPSLPSCSKTVTRLTHGARSSRAELHSVMRRYTSQTTPTQPWPGQSPQHF